MSVRGTLGMSDVYPGIYLGSACVVTPHDLFTRNVKCLVWATPEIDPVPLPDDLRVVRVYVKDEEQQQISHYFPSVAQAYRKCLDADCSMCVVCRAGISRSATLVLAALMTCSDLSLREAYTIVKAARPIIRPNHGFFKQLVEYEREIRGRTTVALVPSPYDSRELVPDVYLEEIQQGVQGTFNMFLPLA